MAGRLRQQGGLPPRAWSHGKQTHLPDLENPNTVTEILEWENTEKAQAFLNDPMLKQAMQSLGVIGEPLIRTILGRT